MKDQHHVHIYHPHIMSRVRKFGKLTGIVIVGHYVVHLGWYLYDHLITVVSIPSSKAVAAYIAHTPLVGIPLVISALVTLEVAIDKLKG